MASSGAEFLKRWTEGFQTGRQGRVERDSRLSKQRDQEGLRLLNADVESLVSQIGRPLEMQEWGSLLAKHGRTLQDAGPFVQAGIFAKPKEPVDELDRQLKKANYEYAKTRLEKLLHPQPAQPSVYEQWRMNQPQAPDWVPGSEGQRYDPATGKAVTVPGFQRQSPISGGGAAEPTGPVEQWSDDDLLNWQQKLAPDTPVVKGKAQQPIFAPGAQEIYQQIISEISRRRLPAAGAGNAGGPWWLQGQTFDRMPSTVPGGQVPPPMSARRRVFDPATGTLR